MGIMATINGTNGNDRIYGTQWDDILRGHAGNDDLNGQGGNDTIDGGPGNDVLRGGAGADVLDGGRGNDNLDGGGVNNRLSGGTGNDTLLYNPGVVNVRVTPDLAGQRMDGGPGRDTLRFSSDAYWDNGQQWQVGAVFRNGTWTLGVGEFYGDDEAEQWDVGTFAGIETLAFDTDQQVFYAGIESDTDLTVLGGSTWDIFYYGDEGSETIDGRGGNDTFEFGRGSGNDVAVVETGADTVYAFIGAPGDKSIRGFSQDDLLNLLFVNDFGGTWDISRGDGRTVLSWTGGSLTVDTEDISGDAGLWGIDFGIGPILDGDEAPVTTRTLAGTSGPDRVSGDGRNDRIEGRAGDDVLQGRGGDDVILGQGGNDTLLGGAGRDILRGGTGNDRLDGGFTGNDLFGDAGNDILIFDPRVEGLVTQDFPRSYLEGGAGRDTVRMVNETEMEHEGRILPGFTRISVEAGEDHNNRPTGEVEGSVSFGNVSLGETVDAWLLGLERYEVVSDGPVQFAGFGNILGPNEITSGLEFVGSRSDDLIEGTPGPDVLEGRAGNDRFSSNGGDRVISDADDEDLIAVDAGNGRVVITGFNGAGAAGGDELLLTGENIGLRAAEDQTGTLISWSYVSEGANVAGSVHVDAFGLVEGIDYGHSVGTTWLERTVLPDYGFVA